MVVINEYSPADLLVIGWCESNLILSSSLSRKFKTFLQDSFSWHPATYHSTPLLEKLRWLPISERIKYKVACVCFNAVNGSGPAYLSELLYTPSRTLRSSSFTRMLKIQQYKRKTRGFRTFSCFGPHIGIHSHKTLDSAQP